jgi:TetR/AcrR family transcriptional repressor of bet genes
MGRRSNRSERRRQIAEALIRTMARKGYEGASIADVAEEAGLTPGLVHYHFESKLEILMELVLMLRQDHDRRLLARIEEAGEDARDQLDALIDFTLAHGREKPKDILFCWITLAGEALSKEPVRAEYERTLDQIQRRILSIIELGVKQQVFAPEDVEAAGAALLSLMQGYFVVAGTARRLIPSGSAAPSARAMMRGLLKEKKRR